jgi:hypothetical protein
MNQFGLIEHWIASYQAMPHQCLAQAAKKRRDETPRLSLKNLTGAFAVLVIGYVISFLVFVFERLQVARRRLITIQRPVDSSHSTKQKASTSSGQYGPDEFVFW